ncbi:Archeal ATPase family protein (modular protein) [Thermococcus camini]|uniref:Archeal ATPase family protein (Modular protein) n=1 Tax=Thermococcus camini TaxID=2016373 RepID=A0A7G2D7F3_9EURY|nr:Archeal ATPase family protein (modular protein) [Thermococcus camini]
MKSREIPFFTPRPRDDELFGREYELRRLLSYIHDGVWVAVLGPRMVGKTSLAKSAIKRYAHSTNSMGIYINVASCGSFGEFSRKVVGSITNAMRTLKSRRKVRSLGVSVYLSDPGSLIKAGFQFNLEFEGGRSAVGNFVSAMNALPPNTVVVFDEIQEVRNRKDLLLKSLWEIYNERSDLRIVFTGSYSGVLKALFTAGEREAMFGRPPEQLILTPWSTKTAEEYLLNGFERCGIDYGYSEIADAILTLGTLPGWLTLYGYKRCKGEPHERAKHLVITEAILKAKRELLNYVSTRTEPHKTISLLKALSEGSKRWNELKIISGLSEPALSEILQQLVGELGVVKKNELNRANVTYEFINEIYREAAKYLSVAEIKKE